MSNEVLEIAWSKGEQLETKDAITTERKEDSETMTRQYEISKHEVMSAWDCVKRAGGAPGYDEQTIGSVEASYKSELYKIWNRMSSGSYMAKPVLLVNIPKVKGGYRQLGIPTVTDRVAQTVIKQRLEPILEPHFYSDSFGYRPGKSAIDAVGLCRQRCFKNRWVLDLDIKGYFDSIDHGLLLEMLKEYTACRMLHLYVERFLKATGVLPNGEQVLRDKGTPQGGVISPLLANLYLHEAFDKWMKERFPEIEFERYADDIIVHCATENQAYYLKKQIERRLSQFKLKLHPEKTRVVYTGRNNKDDRGKGQPRKFTFLGYEFKPREFKGRQVFTPALGLEARKTIRKKVAGWRLDRQRWLSLEEIAKKVSPVIRGWLQYYGHFRRSALHGLAEDIDRRLARWLHKKHDSIKSYSQAWSKLKHIKRNRASMFPHWHLIKLGPTRAV